MVGTAGRLHHRIRGTQHQPCALRTARRTVRALWRGAALIGVACAVGLACCPATRADEALVAERARVLEHIRQSPEDAAGFEALAVWLFQTGDVRRAAAAAGEAARLEPKVPGRQRLLGYLQAANGNVTAAEGAFRRAAALDPAGRAWLADFHIAQAWAEYQDALRSSRSDAALADRVRALGAVGETSPELKLLMRAVPIRAEISSDRVPPIFLAPEVEHALVVEKRTQTLRLYARNGTELRLQQTYPCTTGQEAGAKQRSGDLRTPDGVYVVADLLQGDRLPDRYGALALPLSYPNAWDRRLGHDGRGIWLHGSDRLGAPFTRRDTSGCVVLRNEDLLDLLGMIEPGVTPILIAEDIPDRPVAEWQATVQALLHDVPVTRVLAVVAGPEYAVVIHRDDTTVIRDFVANTDHWSVLTSEHSPVMGAEEWQTKLSGVLPAPAALLQVQVLDGEDPPRIVIDTSGPVGVRGYRAELTDELYVDLPGVRAAPIPNVVPGRGAWVKTVRVTPAQIDPPLTRLVVSLRVPMEYRIANDGGNHIVVSLTEAR